MIRRFQRKLGVIKHLQFLMFGQMIPTGGFRDSNVNRKYTYKSMKTRELKEIREEELKVLDDTE